MAPQAEPRALAGMPWLEGEAHEVPDDQEIAGKAHPADDAQLVFEPVAALPCDGLASP